MVVQNASNPSLQSFPRAAELLASGTRDPTVLANLKSWAPGELTRSLHLLSSECGKNPIVRQYALRSLDTCNPDQVRILSYKYSVIVSQYSIIVVQYIVKVLQYSIIVSTHKTLCRRCLAILWKTILHPKVASLTQMATMWMEYCYKGNTMFWGDCVSFIEITLIVTTLKPKLTDLHSTAMTNLFW